MDFTSFWLWVSSFAELQFFAGFFACVIIILLLVDDSGKKKFSWVLKILLPAVLFSYASSELLKLLFQVPRPCAGLISCETGYSFPSNHASVAAAFAIAILIKSKDKRLYVPLMIYLIMIISSRLLLNYHTMLDVIGGAGVGILTSMLITKYYFDKQ